MITAGIDCGAKFTKAVVLKDGRVIGRGVALTGFDAGGAAGASLKAAMDQAGIGRSGIFRALATGSRAVPTPQAADGLADEIKAMASAAVFFFPKARTVVDVGAEDGRAAKIDERGGVVDAVQNEKCAAGAGAFVESMAQALEVSLDAMGTLSLSSEKQIPLNAQCVVFAESEVVGLIHANVAKADISRAIHEGIAGRIVALIRRIGVNQDLVLIGGMARNPGFVACLARQLTVEKLHVPDAPEFGAAVGAALLAAEIRT